MQAVNRRAERRQEVIDCVVRDTGFQVRRTVDLTHHEKAGRYLEGTGSLVLDHVARVAYACRSPRTDEQVARDWAREMNYELELFGALDARGTPIYHTNVVMSIGARMAVVALENIDAADRKRVAARLSATHELLPIDDEEMAAFAGNVLELGTLGRIPGRHAHPRHVGDRAARAPGAQVRAAIRIGGRRARCTHRYY